MRVLLLTTAATVMRSVAADGAFCESGLDCSLNGVCVDKACVCDPGWTSHPSLSQGSPDCGMLDLKPVKSYESFHGISEQSSSWGGSVLQLPAAEGVNSSDGTVYAMFAAEMTHNCTLRHWLTNSEVVLAVADSPTGPYKEQFQVIPPWAHNPEAILTSDGTVVIYTLGDGIPYHGPEFRCDEPPAPAPKPPPAPPPAPPSPTHTANFTLHYAPAKAGAFTSKDNWKALNVSILDFPTEFQWPGNWNPAPIALPDGRVRVMVHTGWSRITGNLTGWSGEVIIEADDWRGPYRVISSKDITSCTYCEEDPYMWQARRPPHMPSVDVAFTHSVASSCCLVAGVSSECNTLRADRTVHLAVLTHTT